MNRKEHKIWISGFDQGYAAAICNMADLLSNGGLDRYLRSERRKLNKIIKGKLTECQNKNNSH